MLTPIGKPALPELECDTMREAVESYHSRSIEKTATLEIVPDVIGAAQAANELLGQPLATKEVLSASAEPFYPRCLVVVADISEEVGRNVPRTCATSLSSYIRKLCFCSVHVFVRFH